MAMNLPCDANQSSLGSVFSFRLEFDWLRGVTGCDEMGTVVCGSAAAGPTGAADVLLGGALNSTLSLEGEGDNAVAAGCALLLEALSATMCDASKSGRGNVENEAEFELLLAAGRVSSSGVTVVGGRVSILAGRIVSATGSGETGPGC
jgi:hypothetical protein